MLDAVYQITFSIDVAYVLMCKTQTVAKSYVPKTVVAKGMLCLKVILIIVNWPLPLIVLIIAKDLIMSTIFKT